MAVEHGQFWSEEDIALLRNHPEWSAALAGKVLGRTPASVANMRHQLRHGTHSPHRDFRRAPGIVAKVRDVYYATAVRPLKSTCPIHRIEVPVATGVCEDCA